MTQVKNGGSIAAKTERKKAQKTILDLIPRYGPTVARLLPAKIMTPERFIQTMETAVKRTPALQNCEMSSFFGAMLTASQLGLEPNTPLGLAYLIPYYNRKTNQTEAQLQIGYKGMIDLFYRSGMGSSLQAHVVHANDVFEYEYGMEPKLRHVPAMGDPGEMIAVYAVVKLKDGAALFEVMSRAAVEAHMRQFSKSYSNGPWKTNFEEMAKKTVIKQALKYAPMKAEIASAVASDETTLHLEMPADGADPFINPEYEVIDTEAVDPATGEVIGDVEAAEEPAEATA